MTDLSIVKEGGGKEYAVMLPCSQEHFREFLAALLSRGQSIKAIVDGVFEISKEDLINLHHLITQRLRQQNDATLVQFSISISYDDRSSVLLNSLEEFEAYAEIRPHISQRACLTWVFLINFPGRAYPEKQEITVTFAAEEERRRVAMTSGRIADEFYTFVPGSLFTVEIKHSARSWGVDIESLLVGHLKTL